MTKMQIFKHAAFIILVPSVVVGGYYGFKFLKKKYDDRKKSNENETPDFSGMDFYRLTFPHTDTSASNLYDAIGEIKYLPIGERTVTLDGKIFNVIEISIKPEDLDKLKKAFPSTSNNKLDKFDIKDSSTLSAGEIATYVIQK